MEPKFHYHALKSPPIEYFLNEINPFHILLSYFFKVDINIIPIFSYVFQEVSFLKIFFIKIF
jgi:hypothetical protein